MQKHSEKPDYLLFAMIALIYIICIYMETELRKIDELSYVGERLILYTIPGVFSFILFVKKVVVLKKAKKPPTIGEVLLMVNSVAGIVIYLKYGILPLWGSYLSAIN